MKEPANIAAWVRRYRRALMRHPSPESADHARTSQRLGEQAVALGMEPLDVARIHERAVAARTARDGFADLPTMEKAQHFFADVLTPIEQTHRAAQEANAQAEEMTHRIMSSQEAERKEMGRLQQDEIAQALLAIHIRLLALKNAARSNTENLKKEIAATQQMVELSAKAIDSLAHALDGDHET